MGWTFSHRAKSKSDIIAEIERDYKTVETATRGSEHWALVRHPDGYLHIMLFLLQKDRKDKIWGYKDLDESEGPYYWNCPEKFLKKSKVLNAKWRERVQEHKLEVTARKNLVKSLKVGDRVLLDKRQEIQITGFMGRSVTFTHTNGTVYRANVNRISSI